nr:hypothetical protein [Bacteroides ovatus]
MHSDGNGITADHPQDRKTAGRVPLPSVQAAMPDTVPRYAGRHPPVAESRIQGASCTHSVGGRPAVGKNPVYRADGTGETGSRRVHILSGRTV